MGIINRFFKREPAPVRLMVLGLEGLGIDFIRQAAQNGVMPNLGELLEQGAVLPTEPVLPTVSSVAWADYATGVNPGRHGVFGFVDRTPHPFSVHIPTSRDLKVPPLWDYLSQSGKRVGVMNVPLSYPPRQVAGFMVGCFLSPDLAKATYPVELAPKLMEMEYRLDADTSLAMEDPQGYLEDLAYTMTRRFYAAFMLMKSESWDFFHLHIFSTDRFNYSFWQELSGASGEHEYFSAFYRKLDSYIGELADNLPEGCRLAVLSSHGFCKTKSQVYVNRWLEENGYLLFARGKKELLNMHPDTRAYSLVPGRVYINLKGREEKGSVEPGSDYEELREELIHRLGGLTGSKSGEPVVGPIYRREDLYHGPQLDRAPDLLIEPRPGYDLKAGLESQSVMGPAQLPGMHVSQGGFLFLDGVKEFEREEGVSLKDASPTFLKILGFAAPEEMEGGSLI